ncbi:MAG: peptide chain release factor N(5)-glutamine methyltransferase [Hyphomonadaceae bacterium]|nr:peptide chain release factor N(5)-glutamine methyltransferase [Hyphomonadaceae bacterium]
MSEQTLLTAWQSARDRLKQAGVETPAFDARLMLEAGAGVSRMDILTDPHRALNAQQAQAVEKLVARREAREPAAYILGKKAFWKYELTVTPSVLTPRPETELLVEAALEQLRPDAPLKVLDLGVGSGAIAIALLLERRKISMVGVDKSAEALAIARFNAVALHVADRLELRESDWGADLPDAEFDLVVSNPPYVRHGAIDLLAPEIARHEPRLALDGGRDGLEAYRALLPQVRRLLKQGGGFLVEIGEGQAEAVWAHATAAGLSPEGVRNDLSGRARVVFGRNLGRAPG